MENLNISMSEAVCIDEEVFFGPVTEKERKIREHFENAFKTENNAIDNDISKNDSLYKSFSVDDSKYESFDDSLNEGNHKIQEPKLVTVRKSFDKLKSKRQGIYDSLEDVCSLASNIDRCSISHEVTNDTNLNNKHVIEDSLMNVPVTTANKCHGLSEQFHFDDDSLAIIEYENTFDDSLEEVHVLESIEVEEIEDIENIVVENVSSKIEQNIECMPKNLFETSVEIICDKRQNTDVTDFEESSDDKNLLYDSLSNSDLKDILKDSLEESEKNDENSNLSKCVSDVIAGSNPKTEEIFCSKSSFDTSVQIIYENCRNFSNFENISEKTNSDCNDISKDSLENSKNLETSVQQTYMATNDILTSQSSNANNELVIPGSNITQNYETSSSSRFDVNQNSKIVIDNPVAAEFGIPLASKEISDIPKENISVDSCHLKALNDKLSEDKDLKFQVHMEVTVGDKGQISSEDLKLEAAVLNSEKEIDCVSAVAVDDTLEIPVHYSSNFSNNVTDMEIAHLTDEKPSAELEKSTVLSGSKNSDKSLNEDSIVLDENKICGAISDKRFKKISLTLNKIKTCSANPDENLNKKFTIHNENNISREILDKSFNEKSLTLNESENCGENSDTVGDKGQISSEDLKLEAAVLNSEKEIDGASADAVDDTVEIPVHYSSNFSNDVTDMEIAHLTDEKPSAELEKSTALSGSKNSDKSLNEDSIVLDENKICGAISDKRFKKKSLTLNKIKTCSANPDENLNEKFTIHNENKISREILDKSFNEKSLTLNESETCGENSDKSCIEKPTALDEVQACETSVDKNLNEKSVTPNENETCGENSDKSWIEKPIALNKIEACETSVDKNLNEKAIISDENKICGANSDKTLNERSTSLSGSETYRTDSNTNFSKKSQTLNENQTCEANSDKCLNEYSIIEDSSNVTLRAKSSGTQMFVCSEKQVISPEKINDISLLKALDLHDSFLSFLNDSVTQSEDSLMPLNLWEKENKENKPEQFHHFSKKDFCDCRKLTNDEVTSSNVPKNLQTCSNTKVNTKKTPGTKIPVRKIEKFAVPVYTPNKVSKQVYNVHSHEKVKKCQHSPHSVDGGKKESPNKGHHYCKVRNTIFSKVPQIVTPKKYMNIQSPVAQYIRNNRSAEKTPGFDTALRDYMNRQAESPYFHQTPKSGSAKKKP